MAVSSSESNAPFTVGMVAGLPKYKGELLQRSKMKQLSIEEKGSVLTITTVVLVLLTVIAAAVCANAFAFAGNGLQMELCYGIGAVFGAIALASLIWLVVEIVRSVKNRRVEEQQELAYQQTKVENADILSAMKGATHDQIIEAMDKMGTHRNEFIGHVQNEYASLTDENKTVVAAISSYPDDLAKLTFTNRDFALEVLAKRDAKEFGKEKDLVTKLFTKIGKPQNEQEAKKLAVYPTMSAELAKKEDVTVIYQQMTTEQKTEFLKQLNSATAYIALTLTETLQVDEPTKLLLQQIARWPKEAADYIYSSKAIGNHALIKAFFEAMTSDNQALFINRAVQKVNYALEKINNGQTLDQMLAKMTSENKLALLEAAKANQLHLWITKVTAEDQVAYFKKHPQSFKSFVLENPSCDHKIEMALDVLEKMDAEAENVIPIIDNLVSFDHFNLLTNALIEQAKTLDPTTVSETKARLIARFKYTDENDNTTLKGLMNISRKPDGPDWNNFNTIAATQKGNVWKNKT